MRLNKRGIRVALAAAVTLIAIGSQSTVSLAGIAQGKPVCAPPCKIVEPAPCKPRTTVCPPCQLPPKCSNPGQLKILSLKSYISYCISALFN